MTIVLPRGLNRYRGFYVGYVVLTRGEEYKAAWKSSLDDEWEVGHLIVGTPIDALKLARECIDFNCLVEVEEVLLGRKLTHDELADLGRAT